MNMSKIVLIISGLAVLLSSCSEQKQELSKPNILWITSEDNSPLLGSYGDEFATTPNLDKLAASSFIYTHAYANAPVCAPARNTIITGVYANSGGNQHMRSTYNKSDVITFFPKYLREAGYYCTNYAKEDYNISEDQIKNVWDESGNEAHYNKRAPGQPFFAVFNTGISHESSLHTSIPNNELRHKPEDVVLPPYHPDTPEMRHDWAQYYDKIEDMDTWVGGILKELEESGEAENTIIIYYGDHGGVLGRSKRFVYETGTRVPFIVHIPEKYKHLYPEAQPGSQVDRLISFVDLAPTMLSLVGIDIPDFMQGDVFLGDQKTDNPEYAYMFRGRMDERYDMSRAVRDQKYRYIRNYMPYRIYGQPLEYLWRAPSMRSWEAACKAGQCNEVQNKFWNTKPVEELYDTENDPWEVNNIALDPAYANVLNRMRKANHDWVLKIKDTGFIPEAELLEVTENIAAYDYMRSGQVNLEKIVNAAEQATSATSTDIPKLLSFLDSDNAVVRYWGATGLLILDEAARPVITDLKQAADDPSPSVAIVAAEALYNLGEKSEARKTLLEALISSNQFARTHALSTINCTDEQSEQIKEEVIALLKGAEGNWKGRYDFRSAKQLFLKWGLDPQNYGLELL
jgi:arylsulfatase A-like enzyme